MFENSNLANPDPSETWTFEKRGLKGGQPLLLLLLPPLLRRHVSPLPAPSLDFHIASGRRAAVVIPLSGGGGGGGLIYERRFLLLEAQLRFPSAS